VYVAPQRHAIVQAESVEGLAEVGQGVKVGQVMQKPGAVEDAAPDDIVEGVQIGQLVRPDQEGAGEREAMGRGVTTQGLL